MLSGEFIKKKTNKYLILLYGSTFTLQCLFYLIKTLLLIKHNFPQKLEKNIICTMKKHNKLIFPHILCSTVNVFLC